MPQVYEMRLALCLCLVSLLTCGSDSSPTPDNDAGSNPANDGGTSQQDSSVGPAVDAGPGVDAGPRPEPTDPRDSANVYFVGHSLISHRDWRHPSARIIPEVLEDLARAGGQGFGHFRHSTPGAPLSWNWNSVPELRQEIENNAAAYDTMVVTEGIFLDAAYMWHRSPFFARRFFCTLVNARPDAELFVYETWHHVYASDPDGNYPAPHVYDWVSRIEEDRPRWERIVDEAASGATPTPDSYYRGAGDCEGTLRVRLIPAGTALAELQRRIAGGEDWGGLTIHNMIQNGYRDWPAEWPVSPADAPGVDYRSRIAGLSTYESRELDDIHHGREMAYYISLVMYATIYRRSPVGLPAGNGVSPDIARRMQELVWDIVTRDPRSGVAG